MKSKFELLIDAMPVTVSQISSDMTYINVNKKLTEVVGLKKEDIIGKKVGFTQKNKDFSKLIDDIFDLENDFATMETQIFTKNGCFDYLLIASRFNDKKELILIGIDITPIKQQEKLLINKARFVAMGEMIGNIAHQWRQPLSAIGAITADLQIKKSLNQLTVDDIEKPLLDIATHTQFLSATVNDFRNFFKEDKELESVNPLEIIKKALLMTEHSLKANNIELKEEYVFSKKLFTFPNELVQVFLNLIKNAQDALVEKEIQNPWIKIKGYEIDVNNTIVFEISDNAKGIPEEIKERIFEPYFTTKNENGTGLGLYMSKIIVEKHCKGKLSVQNCQEGAKFTVVLKGKE